MYELIASRFLGDLLALRPGSQHAVKIGAQRYRDLLGSAATPDAACPPWLVDATRARWGLSLEGRGLVDTVVVRAPSTYGYGRASYELNLGCNYDC